MRHITHIVTCAGLSVFVFSFFNDVYMLLMITGIALALGGINDWMDFAIFRNLEHRAWITHSLLSPIFLVVLLILIPLSAIFYWLLGLMIFIIFCIAWTLHVILDSLTYSGVSLFLPGNVISGNIHYKDAKWNWILLGSGIGLWVIGLGIGFLIYSL